METDLHKKVAQALLGSRLTDVGHAADMREFVFESRTGGAGLGVREVFLHVQCAWRLEFEGKIVTGNLDWYVPDESAGQVIENWEPAAGGSIQELKLREVLRDQNSAGGLIHSNVDGLFVTDVRGTPFGDLEIILAEKYRLCLFPAGCDGEHWRVFIGGDLASHLVCKGDCGAV